MSETLKGNVWLAIAVVCIAVLLMTCIGTDSDITYEPYVVTKGETLWSIAAERTEGVDINKVLYEMRKVNNMTDCIIYEGQTILVPEVQYE